MATIINADNGVTSGSLGLKTSADASGILQLQTNGNAAVTVYANTNVNFSGNITSNGAIVPTLATMLTYQLAF